MNRGIGYAVGAYVLWGLLPVYWKWLHGVPALQLLGHRIVWSFAMLFATILLLRRWKSFQKKAFTGPVFRATLPAAVLIAINWLTYIWAVNSGFMIETSLGYFINPVFSVILGVLFFGERLRPGQWLPIGLAAGGVLFVAFAYGSVPWIALTLAVSFGLYGLVKKKAPLGSVHGLTLETGILLLPALLWLLYAEKTGAGAFLHSSPVSSLLLVGAGWVTTVPLLLFASAARRIPLSLVGILQYISPTLQFLLGVVVYHEPFTRAKLAGFCIVWMALVLFGIEGVMFYRSRRIASAAEESKYTFE